MKALLAMTAFVGFAAVANAGIGVETYGAAAPPGTVNGTPVTAAPFDGRIFSDVPSAPLAAGDGNVTFSQPLSCRQIGFGWATWSHGYTGNCYYTNGATSITMSLSGIKAFQFYGEPNPFGVFQMTATGSDGSSSTASQQFPDGSSGAAGWGFYGTGGSDVASVQVSSDVDFAVGEFASSRVPAPASLGLLGLGGLVAGRRRR